MIDVDTPEGEWFHRLANELHNRRTGRSGGRLWNRSTQSAQRIRPPLSVLDDYRQGDPPLRADIHSGWKPYVRAFVRMGRLNVADLAITATANRMPLRDFRTAAPGDELGDAEARKIMRANGMKVKARDVHETMLALGDAYTIVTPPSDGRTNSLITAEDPREVITAHDPATGETLAALKMFRDEWDSEDIAYLYLPGVVRKARRKGVSLINNGAFRFDKQSWTFEDDTTPVPDNRIPVVRFRNRDGVGEFERHLDTLDRINDKIFDEWWIAKIQAFRQRAVKNLPDTKQQRTDDGRIVEVPIDDDEYADMFTASPDEMWRVPADVDFWESSPVDLTPITAAIQKDLERYSAMANIPLHIITPDAANGSAEGASLMREEHVYKVEARRDLADVGWAETMSMAFLFQGDTARADVTQIEAVWGPAERFSLAQKSEAASKAGGSLPVEAIQRDIWQYAPAEIPNLRAMKGSDIFYQTPATQPTFQEPGNQPQGPDATAV